MVFACHEMENHNQKTDHRQRNSNQISDYSDKICLKPMNYMNSTA